MIRTWIVMTLLAGTLPAQADTYIEDTYSSPLLMRDWTVMLLANQQTLVAQGVPKEQIMCVTDAASAMLKLTQGKTEITVELAATALKSASKDPEQSCVFAAAAKDE